MTTAHPPFGAPFPERPPAPTSVPAPGPDRAADAAARRTATGRPRWERPAYAGLLLATAVLLLWNLGASGYANSFYSAAVQAGSESWKAFFFGSSDAGNSITVDKPPAALWPMMLSVRAFGLGFWQILVPQALMGVATTAVLYAAVRRQFGPAAALIGGAAFALTPVAALMFRFNNPDALLTLLLTVTVCCVLRALDGARTGWLVAAGAAIGLGFLTKTLQAFVILPPLVLLYAVCAPARLRRRLGQLLLAGAAMVVTGGWWVAVVELWPASSRPYIGGSQHNSFLELTFGYNGLGRLNGDETGSVGGGRTGGAAGAFGTYGLPEGGPGLRGGGGGWGETGVGRLFSGTVGGQISWLLPAALVLLVAGLVVTWRAGRATDCLQSTARAAFLAWGGCLLITAVVFSWMQGIFHEYYTVALAPFVAALVGMGVAVLWEERGGRAAALTLSGTLALTAVWSYVLLGRSSGYLPWLRWTVLVAGLLAAAALPFAARLGRRVLLGAAALGLGAALAGPFAYCLTTIGTGHTGSIVTAGPAVAGGRGGPGGMRFGPGGEGFGGGMPGLPGGGPGGGAPQGGSQGAPQGAPQGGQGGGGTAQGFPRGAWPGPGQAGGAAARSGTGSGAGSGRGMRGGAGGLLDGARVSAGAEAALRADASRYTWAAAAIGSQNAASYQLASGRPVMPLGGFNGSDPSPTLEQFKAYVKAGKIHWFIAQAGLEGGAESRAAGRPGGQGGPGGQGAPGSQGAPGGQGGPGGSASTAVESWVKATFKAVTIDGATFYDLTAPSTGTS
ncbi:4-amino-4-deoxy-L-arabinose transferase-like glycosyltransferase [Streptomyces sp. 3211.6]|uniref:ArnT family glycosyltransferase n=1 Tax=Streptomyces sp. 3211.6 TaxID=1938845 RepID=UPI000EB44F05|nr:glycosyltransferase family 39 protein [Streptomyces sp. 3211.6]RKT05811.1 4-amino-4-deoxy-L-arabinose transferase-like glycosyltransferase [Streptomyces sp. 3211.6]